MLNHPMWATNAFRDQKIGGVLGWEEYGSVLKTLIRNF